MSEDQTMDNLLDDMDKEILSKIAEEEKTAEETLEESEKLAEEPAVEEPVIEDPAVEEDPAPEENPSKEGNSEEPVAGEDDTKRRKIITADDLKPEEEGKKNFRDYYAEQKKKKRRYGSMTLDEKRGFYEGLEKEDLIARIIETDGAIPTKDRVITQLKQETNRLERVILAIQNERLTETKNEIAPTAQAVQEDAHSEFINKYKDVADEALLKDLLKEASKGNGENAEEIKRLHSKIESSKVEENIRRSRENFDQAIYQAIPDIQQVSNSSEFKDFSSLRFDELSLNDSDAMTMAGYKISGHRTVGEVLSKSTDLNITEPIVLLLKHFKDSASALKQPTKSKYANQIQPSAGSQTITKPTQKRDLGSEMADLVAKVSKGDISHNEYMKQQTKLENELIKQKG